MNADSKALSALSAPIRASASKGFRSCFGAPSLQREQALRPLLDEQDDHHQHEDLRQHRAGKWLEELGDRAEAERSD